MLAKWKIEGLQTTKGIMTGKELRELRLMLNMTQSDFGIALGYAPGSAKVRVSELENGQRDLSPMVDLLAAYIKKFGVLSESNKI